ncbi:MAG: acetate--CoA ligase family protein [Candidatus Helarchaeota archaeon]
MGNYDIRNLEILFNPKTIAVFGAGKNLNKVGGQVLLHLVMGNFRGRIFPINPKKESVFNLETISTLKTIPEKIDLAILAIPKKQIYSALEGCFEENVRFVIILTAGFQETIVYDVGGPELQDDLKRLLTKHRNTRNTRIIGPNCMGIASTHSYLNALMGINPIPYFKKNMNMSFISQSGTWAAVAMRDALQHDLGVSKIISTGNELDLTFEDFLEFLAFYDKHTQVIGAFIEQLRNGRKFIKILSETSKPIVLIKAGSTESGSKAALSHTGSLSKGSDLYHHVFKQYGIIEAESLSELMNYLRAFAIYMAKNTMPKGKRVGIYTVGGGLGVLTADSCERAGLEIAQLTPKTIDRLNNVLSSIWSHNNPIDLVATRDFSTTEKVLRILIEAEEIDMIISIVPFGISIRFEKIMKLADMPQIREHNRQMLQVYHNSIVDHLLKFAGQSDKPIILPTSLFSVDLPFQYEEISKLFNAGICVVNNVHDAAKTLSQLVKFQQSIMKRNLKKK